MRVAVARSAAARGVRLLPGVCRAITEVSGLQHAKRLAGVRSPRGTRPGLAVHVAPQGSAGAAGVSGYRRSDRFMPPRSETEPAFCDVATGLPCAAQRPARPAAPPGPSMPAAAPAVAPTAAWSVSGTLASYLLCQAEHVDAPVG